MKLKIIFEKIFICIKYLFFNIYQKILELHAMDDFGIIGKIHGKMKMKKKELLPLQGSEKTHEERHEEMVPPIYGRCSTI